MVQNCANQTNLVDYLYSASCLWFAILSQFVHKIGLACFLGSLLNPYQEIATPNFVWLFEVWVHHPPHWCCCMHLIYRKCASLLCLFFNTAGNDLVCLHKLLLFYALSSGCGLVSNIVYSSRPTYTVVLAMMIQNKFT